MAGNRHRQGLPDIVKDTVMAERVQLRVASISALVILLGAISGCAAGGNGHHDPATSRDSTSSTPTDRPTTEATAAFALPATCTDLIGADLEAAFQTEGIELFSDPGGSGEIPNSIGTMEKYSYTQKSGTPFICAYTKFVGENTIETANTIEISVQGLTQDAHKSTLAALRQGGFVETTDGAVVTLSQVGNFTGGGDPEKAKAIVHVVHPDSWITIACYVGGSADQMTRINQWLPIVTAQVYP
jgi:hypothetical protein